MNKKLYILVPLLSLFVSGCLIPKPFVRNIKSEAIPEEIHRYPAPRDCNIELKPTIDKRPSEGKTVTDYSKFTAFVPALIYFYAAKEGPIYAETKYYDSTLLESIDYLLKEQVARSNLSSGSGKTYTIQPELLHYYGVGYAKAYSQAIGKSSSSNTYAFFPTGYVAIKLSLLDENGKSIRSQVIQRTYLFNDKDELHKVFPNNSTYIATKALTGVLKQFPQALDVLMSGDGSLPAEALSDDTFIITRLTKEYEYLEEVVIERSTQRILSTNMVERTAPIYSRPDEWVVAPYTQSGHWMNSQEYSKLLEKLKEQYDVGYGENISVASFYGVKESTETETVSTESE